MQNAVTDFKELADLLPHSIFETDERGNLTFANRETLAGFGYSEADLANGLNVLQLFIPEDRKRLLKNIQRLLGGERPDGAEYAALRKDGAAFHASVWASPILRDGRAVGLRGVVTDVTERKRWEDELRRSEQRFRHVVETAQEGIVMLDGDARITYANRHMSRMWGCEEHELIGKTVFDLVDPEMRSMAEETFKRRKQGVREVFEISFRRADGSRFLASVSANPMLEAEGRFVGSFSMVTDISARRLAEEALQETVRRAADESTKYEGILAAMGDGVSIQGTDLRILYQNQALKDMIGEHVGEHCYQAYEKRDRVCEGCGLATAFQTGRTHRSERSALRDGGLAHVEITSSPLRDATGRVIAGIEIVRDITARKKSEEERQKLVALVEHSSDLIGVAGVDGRVIYINDAGQKLVGLDGAEQARTTTMTDYILEDDVPAFRERVLPAVEVHGRWMGESRLRHFKTGLAIPVEMNAFSIREPSTGQLIALATVCRDTTERKQLEEELLRARKLESLGVLAGGIAHDFNNLLTAILGNVALAKMHAEPAGTIFERLGESEKACFLAQDLTRQLLTFSKGGAPVRSVASIRDLIEDSSKFALRGSNVRCEFSFSPDLWPVEVDPGQIGQVVNNLVLNADQAMPGGGTIRIRGENVTVGQEEPLPLKSGDYVKVTIKDEGIGIPPEYLGRVFDPYFTTKKKGSGLGLATVYSIIKKHDGHVTVESEMGTGTTFRFYLPASRGQAQPVTQEAEAVLSGSGRVLVVDDDELIRNLMRQMLVRLGYEVEVAEDGRGAIGLYEGAREAGRPYDVVIMDLTIPGGMGGVEAIRRLREIDPGVSAIVSSGYSTDPVLADYGAYGFRGMVRKPFQIQELSRVLRQVIGGG